MCANFVRYLVGKQDFYKVVSRRGGIVIHGFNLNGTLNITATKLPTRIIAISNLNGSQYSKNIIFNEGWTFNFRIHNASSRVESSLKFDVNAIALPPRLYQNHIDHPDG